MMEQRKLLEKGTALGFPGMTCTIEECVGYGSNAVVYKGWYEDNTTLDSRHYVLIKELNPSRRENMDAHRLSFERGNRAHLTLLEKHPEIIGENINTFSYHNTLYTVLGCSGGTGLDEVIKKTGRETTLRRHAERMLSVLDALEAFHDSGFLHLDVSPDNILVIRSGSTERLLLIDYNSVFSPGECQSGEMPYSSFKEGFTAPEVTTGSFEKISYSADLYSVTAVFFACLTGRSLRGIVEKRRCGVPAVFESECLRDAPDTVRNMIACIMTRGLSVLPKNRYQDVGQLRSDLLELIDRIDCVGVTHWAIWEKSRQSLFRIIEDNPSLQHVVAQEELYPIRIKASGSEMHSLEEFAGHVLCGGREPVMLMAGGGMGKTTSMLRMALLQNQRYSPKSAAAVYISAYGLTADEPNFIRNRILDMLKFSSKTANYDAARHELNQLLQKPAEDGGEGRPAFLILLDGINEVSGDLTPLTKEIAELSRMEGVQIVLSSRSDIQGVCCRVCELAPLDETHIEQQLAQNGLLMPENEQMRALLSTPMALSIFIRAAKEEQGQLRVSSTGELIRAYLKALLSKETAELPPSAPQRYMIEAALDYVLPGVAGETIRRGRALTGIETLSVAEGCYRLLGSREMLRAFPQWIGHSADIRGGAKSAEEWYGVIVGELLWRRMGLLTADEDGRFRIAHQIIEEYLSEIDQENRRRIGRQRAVSRAKTGAAAAALSAMLAACYFLFIYVKPYEMDLATSVMEYAGSSYVQCGYVYQDTLEVVNHAIGGSLLDFNAAYDAYQSLGSANHTNRRWIQVAADKKAESMIATGEAFSWSRKPLDMQLYGELTGRAQARAAVYDGYLAVLYAVMNDGQALEGDALSYAEMLKAVLEADAAVSAALYETVTRIHADEAWNAKEAYLSMLGDVSGQEAFREAIMSIAPENYRSIYLSSLDRLQDAEDAINASVLNVRYRQ